MSKIQLIIALAALVTVGGSVAPTLAQFAPPPIPGGGPGLGLGARPGPGPGFGAGPRAFGYPGNARFGHGDLPRFGKSPGHLDRADLPRGETARSALGRGNWARRGDGPRGGRAYAEKELRGHSRDYGRNESRNSRNYGRNYSRNNSRYSGYHDRDSGRDSYYGIYGYAEGSYDSSSNSSSYYYSSDSESHVRWCMNRYRSYDSSTDTYFGSDGYRHRCGSPY